MRWSPGSLATRLWQPSNPVIDWANPLTKGLVLLLPMGQGDRGQRDLVSGAATTRTGTLAQTASRAGGSFPLFGSSQYIDVAQPSGITSTTPCVIFWTQEPRGTTASSAVLDWRASGASNSFLIYESTTAAYNFVVGRRLSNAGAHQVTFSTAVGAPTNNRVDHFALLLTNGMDSVTGVRLWRNGVEMIAGTSGSGNNFGTSTTAGFRLGTLLGGTSDPFEGLLGNVGIIARALTAQEMVSLSANPWQVYAPDARPLWAPFVAGAAENYGIGVETDTAFAPTAKLQASPGLASETDTALGLAASLRASPGIASETDTALPLAAQLRASYGLAQETDTAIALTEGGTVYGVAQEVDNAYALSASLRASYGIAAETDTAFALPVAGVAFGIASETDTAYPLPAQLRTSYGIGIEVDRAYALATPSAPAPSPSPAPSPRPPGPTASLDSEFRSSRNRRFTRPQLAKFLGSAEEIRAFEALDFDTAEATPDAIEEIRQYLATLPAPQPQPNPDQGDGLEVHVGALQAQIEELRGLLMEKNTQINALLVRVHGLEQGYHI